MLSTQLSQLACDRLGLKPEFSIPRVERVIRNMAEMDRQVWCLRLLAADSRHTEWQKFIESLLVHETYFFRHPDQLQLLRTQVIPELIRQRVSRQKYEFKVWCAGCSTGEEAYTLALLVNDAIAVSAAPKRSEWTVRVVGTDVSTLALDHARRGDYATAPGLDSFRDIPEADRSYFPAIFEAGLTRWSAAPDLKRSVQFRQHNLVADRAALTDADLVICRNTLMYFAPDAQRRALGELTTAVRPEGVLVLGPADSLNDADGFEMVCGERAVYWLKRNRGQS